MDNLIIHTEPGGIADEMGIQPGDTLLEINGKQLTDVFDYRYMIHTEYVELLISKADGEQWLLEIEKDEDEDIGIAFESGLMDKPRPCKNKCVFCFIDQLPQGMRETLYFKDDDPRLSFLTGNYVTLTNMSDDELQRVIYYHLSPINISVHSTDAAIRRRMLKNPASEQLMSQINKLNAANITMNFQIVLCHGINDGDALNETMETLSTFMPNAKSLSVVPAGLSKHRSGLFELLPFSPDECATVINQVNQMQKHLMEAHGTRFVYAADEFYIKAGICLPDHTEYEDFPQLENGVGMLPLFISECKDALEEAPLPSAVEKKISLVTAMAAYTYIKELTDELSARYPQININVFPVTNNFFGSNITVSGLLTGADILNELKGKDLGEYILIPKNTLRANEDVFLDNMSIGVLESELGVEIRAVETNGSDFVNNILF